MNEVNNALKKHIPSKYFLLFEPIDLSLKLVFLQDAGELPGPSNHRQNYHKCITVKTPNYSTNEAVATFLYHDSWHALYKDISMRFMTMLMIIYKNFQLGRNFSREKQILVKNVPKSVPSIKFIYLFQILSLCQKIA